jgi:hypothetical protein
MMIGSLFRKVREERKSHEWLLPNLLESLSSERLVDYPGPDDWLSASKISLVCPRAFVIGYRLNLQMVDQVDYQGRWRMDRGTAVHIVLQEMWLGPTGWLLGGWRCPECGRVHTKDMDPEVTVSNSITLPDRCIECSFEPNHFDRFGYCEPWIADESVKVRGRTDGVLSLPACSDEIIDIKSIGTFKYTPRDSSFIGTWDRRSSEGGG